MLMEEATPEKVIEWKEIWKEYKNILVSNRRTGEELVKYIKERYILRELNDKKAKEIVKSNILKNIVYANKLSEGQSPKILTFIIENRDEGCCLYEKQDDIYIGTEIFIGVDIESGFFHVEGSSLLWDELMAFKGLDEEEIQNYFSVAMYILSLKRFQII
ncbi:MAG: hypothetical protein E6248_15785 [Clostridium sp.]|uniref:hypothetical protein n=1 Tax=Clostridium sp. TaxID=1506 RepID=UPI0029129204|nr:hypothetical protein [Clostridium sp.]MDU5111897.1 hypothetical protein [Clostridium sp.]